MHGPRVGPGILAAASSCRSAQDFEPLVKRRASEASEYSADPKRFVRLGLGCPTLAAFIAWPSEGERGPALAHARELAGMHSDRRTSQLRTGPLGRSPAPPRQEDSMAQRHAGVDWKHHWWLPEGHPCMRRDETDLLAIHQ